MRKIIIYFGIIIAISVLFIFHKLNAKEPIKKIALSADLEKQRPDVELILKKAMELREEKIFLIRVLLKKRHDTDWIDMLKNILNPEEKTFIVNEQIYENYAVGEKIKGKSRLIGFIFKENISLYEVYVVKKYTMSQFFWIDKEDRQIEIYKSKYDEALSRLKAKPDSFLTIDSNGVSRTYLFYIAVSREDCVTYEPLKRYFISLEIESYQLPHSLLTQLYGVADFHLVDIEVSADTFNKAEDLWLAEYNNRPFILNGYLSHFFNEVKIAKKTIIIDKNFFSATTKDNIKQIIPQAIINEKQ